MNPIINHPLALGEATEASREISEKLQNDLTISSSPEYAIPLYLDNPPYVRAMNFHAPSSTVGPHQFKHRSEEVIDSKLFDTRKGHEIQISTTTTTHVIEIEKISLQAGWQQRAKIMMQKMNIQANQTEKGRKRCLVCLVQWTIQFVNFPPHIQLPVLTQVEGDNIFCPFANDHKMYQQIMAGKMLICKLKNKGNIREGKIRKNRKNWFRRYHSKQIYFEYSLLRSSVIES